MLFSCCENLVGIYKNAKAAFDKSSSKKVQIFSLWVAKACKTSFLCVESQSVCIVWFICYTIKSHVQSKFKSISGLVIAAVKEDSMILHVIVLYFPLAHYDFLQLWYLFVTYTLFHLHRGFEICSSYETYIIRVVRVDTFDCSLFFDASYWQAAPRL